MGVDPLAEGAYGWTPFRYGFNNPILYFDPDGLFEDRDAAKKYAKDNNIKTGIFRPNRIKKQSDGTFAIENKSAGTFTEGYAVKDEFGNDQVLGVTGALISDKDVMKSTYEQHESGIPLSVTYEHRDGTSSEHSMLSTGTAPGPGKIAKGYQYVKTIGKKYDVYQKTVKAKKLSGQARAVYTKIKNKAGRTVRFFKDAFKRDGRHYERANYKPHKSRSRKLD